MLITIIFTFFIGCGFYFIAATSVNTDYSDINFLKMLENEKLSTQEWTQENDVQFYDCITVLYFSITTLSTVGYGDITA